MDNIMKKEIIAILIVPFLVGIVTAQEKKEEKEVIERIIEPGILAVSLDYYSNYLFRGTEFFNGDGCFYPKASWTMFNTSLLLSVSSEIAASFGWPKKPDEYLYGINSFGKITRKNLNFNHIAYATQSLDVGMDYSYAFKNAVTLGASAWYWWYYNSRHAREYARPQVDGLNMVSYVDISFLTTAVSIKLPIIPFINPTLSLTQDYYTGLRKGGDFYAQFGLSHPFKFIEEIIVTPRIMAGYYYNHTGRLTHYSLVWNPSAGTLSTTQSLAYSGPTRTITWGGIKQVHTPVRKGISDMTPNIVLTYTIKAVSLQGGFYWCIVPAKSWYTGGQIHRLYANLGATYSL